jgi:hypothetical protein
VLALVDFGHVFSFLARTQSVGLFGRWEEPVVKLLPTHGKTQTQNKRTQTSMPLVEFEPTIQVFERAKTVHAVDRATTVIDKIPPPIGNRTPAVQLLALCYTDSAIRTP